MDRLVQRNVLAMSRPRGRGGRRRQHAAAGQDRHDHDRQPRRPTEFIPVGGVSDGELADAAQLSSLADETPEGRSVVVLAKDRVRAARARSRASSTHATFVAFTAQTRMSGVDLAETGGVRAGPQGRGRRRCRTGCATGRRRGARRARRDRRRHLGAGGTPLVVAETGAGGARALGVIHLKDIVKQGMRERFDELRAMGIRTVMITGDNPLTAKAIADEAGVDDFLAEATPEDKMALIRSEQEGGKLVAMTGDGTNDAPALAQADVGVAMNTGTSAAKEAGNMVDLDSNPTKLIEIVEIGKQLLITRGALTTFSIANDVAKYFAIIPAMFAAVYPGPGQAQHHAAALAAVGDPVGGHLQRARHHRADPAGAARRALPAEQRVSRCCAATSTSTASAA